MWFIYKITNITNITNIITNKCYIGETKKANPELRWNEHKSKIDKGIGCTALEDAVRKYDIDKFKYEILIICFDEDRYKFKIEYIKKYNSISPNGYNLTKGGEGGGFYGKRHSQETINNISRISKQKYIDNPELKIEISKRQKIIMNTKEIRDKIKIGIKNSEKWKIAKEQKIVSNCNNRKHSNEVKKKISESVKNSFHNSNGIKIQKHRQIMANFKGIKFQQCNVDNTIINTFISLSEESRQTGISKATIQNGIKDFTKVHCGFIWKKTN